jgi:hypothetical protein
MVVVSLSDKLRIVDCRDQMQWIVQKRQSGRWLGISYHRCRDVMIERWCSGADTMALGAYGASKLPQTAEANGHERRKEPWLRCLTSEAARI